MGVVVIRDRHIENIGWKCVWWELCKIKDLV